MPPKSHYRLELFLNVDEIKKSHLLCVLCGQVAHECMVQTRTDCDLDASACRDCLYVDRTPPAQWCIVWIASMCKREQIEQLMVRCVHHSKCAWTGPRAQLEAHLEKECAHEMFACALGCESHSHVKSMTREKLKTHSAHDCKLRQVECLHCKDKVALCDLPKHIAEHCLELPFDCPYGCETSYPPLTRRTLDEHLKSKCARAPQPCPYAEMFPSSCACGGIVEFTKKEKEEEKDPQCPDLPPLIRRYDPSALSAHLSDRKATEAHIRAMVQDKRASEHRLEMRIQILENLVRQQRVDSTSMLLHQQEIEKQLDKCASSLQSLQALQSIVSVESLTSEMKTKFAATEKKVDEMSERLARLASTTTTKTTTTTLQRVPAVTRIAHSGKYRHTGNPLDGPVQVEDYVCAPDVNDTVLPAFVRDIDNDTARVYLAFCGWGPDCDEWVSAKRLRPFDYKNLPAPHIAAEVFLGSTGWTCCGRYRNEVCGTEMYKTAGHRGKYQWISKNKSGEFQADDHVEVSYGNGCLGAKKWTPAIVRSRCSEATVVAVFGSSKEETVYRVNEESLMRAKSTTNNNNGWSCCGQEGRGSKCTADDDVHLNQQTTTTEEQKGTHGAANHHGGVYRPKVHEPMEDIRENDYVDCLDRYNTWYPARVLKPIQTTTVSSPLWEVSYSGWPARFNQTVDRSKMSTYRAVSKEVGVNYGSGGDNAHPTFEPGYGWTCCGANVTHPVPRITIVKFRVLCTFFSG